MNFTHAKSTCMFIESLHNEYIEVYVSKNAVLQRLSVWNPFASSSKETVNSKAKLASVRGRLFVLSSSWSEFGHLNTDWSVFYKAIHFMWLLFTLLDGIWWYSTFKSNSTFSSTLLWECSSVICQTFETCWKLCIDRNIEKIVFNRHLSPLFNLNNNENTLSNATTISMRNKLIYNRQICILFSFPNSSCDPPRYN